MSFSPTRALKRLNIHTLTLLAALLLLVGAVDQLVSAASVERSAAPVPHPATAERLTSGIVASLDSPAITWSPGWTVSAAGADPAEPADPSHQPAGTLTFEYEGRELALEVAVGDYWGYLYVTVDGHPASLLPDSRYHLPQINPRAGYASLLAPEAVDASGAPTARWLRVHWEGEQPAEGNTHTARVTVWRSWGQTPLRAIAVDAEPGGRATRWPGVALLAAALLLSSAAWFPALYGIAHGMAQRRGLLTPLAVRLLGERGRKRATVTALFALLLIAGGLWSHNGGPHLVAPGWALTLSGVALLAAAALVQPALWYGALLAALPLYYTFPLPLLPARAFNLVDVGVYGGLLLVIVHGLLATSIGRAGRARFAPGPFVLLLLIAGWSIVSLYGAEHFAVAQREVRTVFVMSVALALGLLGMLRTSHDAAEDLMVIVGAWVLGAALVAGVAALLYPRPGVTLPAEGVVRLRGFYGSPNNLALYLDRVLAVALAVAIAGRATPLRVGAAAAAAVLAGALVLTFSKGALFAGLPVMLLTVAVGAGLLLRRQQRSAQVLWLLGGMALVVLIALLPFVTTERLRSLVDFTSGTGQLRLNLWRAAWQMALDHVPVGVGPDNFLYAYRSGYILPQAWMEPNLNHPHNFVLDWWTRLGIPGLLLGLSFWGVMLVALVRRLLHAPAQRESWPALYLGVIAAVLAALAHGLVDASYALPDLMAVWALFTVLATVESPQSLPRS